LRKNSATLPAPTQIRNDLAAKGVVIEDSKDGVRWKRK
jgi:cysteinyl-tRNA synthetase